MGFHEDLIACDPALHCALYDQRDYVPKDGTAPIRMTLNTLELEFIKARTIADADKVVRRIRARFFAIRSRCSGYLIEAPAGHDPGCTLVAEFARRPADFRVDRRAYAAVWYRYAQRPPPPGL